MTQGSVRRLAGAVCAAVLLLLVGCAPGAADDASPWDPRSDGAEAARASASATIEATLAHASGGQVPLTTGVWDACAAGRHDWWVTDSYRHACSRAETWVLADPQPDPALLIAEWRARLEEAGCQPGVGDFDMVEQYWQEFGVPGQTATGERYTVDSLPSASATCPDGRGVGITFRSHRGVEPPAAPSRADLGLIEWSPYELAAIRADPAPHVVILSSQVSWYYWQSVDGALSTDPTEPPSTDPPPCACYSGSPCECPGG